MKKPATTWPTAVPTSVTRVTMPSAPVLSVIGPLDALDVAVELRVGDVQRAGAQPVADLPRPRDDRVAEVAGARGDLLADEGQQQRDRADAEHHDDAGRGPRGRPIRRSQVTSGTARAAISIDTASGSVITAK